jgi:hypothetical protein
VPSGQIDDHFVNLLIGNVDTLKQTINDKSSLIHYTNDSYVNKIMSTHGMLCKIASHSTTGQDVNGEVETFK